MSQYGKISKGRRNACPITVVCQIYLLCIPLQYVGMSRCKCSTKGCHRIIKSCLVHGYYIHISLAADYISLSATFCYIHSKQSMALIKHLGILGVDVLRLSIAQYPSSKADNLAIYIKYGDHRSIPELVRTAILLIYLHKSGVLKFSVGVALFLKIPVQVIPVDIRIAQSKLPDGLICKSSFPEVIIGFFTVFTVLHYIMKVRCCILVHFLKKNIVMLTFSVLFASLHLRDLHTHSLGKELYGLRKA